MSSNWQSWQNFAAMGGYGLYVWGSFGGAAVLLALELAGLRLLKRQALNELALQANLQTAAAEEGAQA